MQSKNILITGASTGIGYASAQAFIKAGYTVYGSVRKQLDADRLSKELGASFHPLLFDVTEHEAIDAVAKELQSQIGDQGLAGLINNAGIALGGPLMHIPMEDLRYQMEVNVIGLVKVTQAFLPLLGAQKDSPFPPGRILNISSVAGKMAMPFLGPYVGSKHAVEGISTVMRRELQLYGIDVIVIGPGAIKTPIWNKGMDINLDVKDYAKPMEIFANKFVRGSIKKGFTAEKLADDILNIFENPKPKTRYSIVAEKFTNWVMPRLLPARFVDKYLGKKLKLR